MAAVDDVLRLRDENAQLRRSANELSEALKRMQVKFSMVESTMRRAEDGSAMAQLVRAEARIADLEAEADSLRKRNRVLADKLRIAEETIRIKARVQGVAPTPGRVPKGARTNAFGVPAGFSSGGSTTGPYASSPGVLHPPPTPGSVASAVSFGDTRGRKAAGGSGARSRSRSAGSGAGSVSPPHRPSSGGGGFEGKSPDTPGAPSASGAASVSRLGLPPTGRPSSAPAAAAASDAAASAAAAAASVAAASALATKDAELMRRGNELSALREQVASLQRSLAAAEARAASAGADSSATALMAPLPTVGTGAGVAAGAAAGTITVPQGDLLELERALRDKAAAVSLLRSRLEHTEAKAAAERSLYDRAVVALEEQNSELRRLRSSLQAAEGDVSLLRQRLAGAGDAGEDLRRAREEIRRLEATITDLAEAPFMRADGAGGGSSFVRDALTARARLESLEASDASHRQAIAQLQAALKGANAEVATAARERGELATALERARDEAERSRAAADAATRSNALLRERLALYGGGAGLEGAGAIPGDALAVPPEELERALAIVRRRMDKASGGTAGATQAALAATVAGGDGSSSSSSSSSALVPVDLADADDAPGPLRRRVQQLQLALLTAQGELDRGERMTAAQTAIARDLAAEVSDLHARLATEGSSLKKALAETTALAAERLTRVHALEAEVSQLLEQARRWRASRGQSRRERERERNGGSATAGAVGLAATGGDGGAASTRRGGHHQQHRRHDGAAGAAAGNNDDDGGSVISGLSDEDGVTRDPRLDGMVTAAGASAAAAAAAARDDDLHHDDDDGGLDDSAGASSLTASEVYDLAAPGENRMEIYIRGAALDPAAFTSSGVGGLRGGSTGYMAASTVAGGAALAPTTFALVDWLNFESQASPLAVGTAPAWRFSAVYPLTADAFTLRQIASATVAVEVHAARGADFTLIGRAAVPLHGLLGGATRVKMPSLQLRGADGAPVGSVSVELRIAVGLATAWQAFARERPAEASTLAALIRRREEGASGMGAGAGGVAGLLLPTGAPSSAGAGASGSDLALVSAADGDALSGVTATAALGVGVTAGARAQANDLLITIVAATGLRAREPASGGRLLASARPPSAYVQYALPLPNAKTVFTPVAPHAYEPVFADTRAIPIVPTAATLAALAASPLHFIVCDDGVSLEPGHPLAAPAPPPPRLAALRAQVAATVDAVAAGVERGRAAAAAAALAEAESRVHAPRAVLGVAAVSLAALAEGLDCEGVFDVVDERGSRVGALSVRAMWARPLVTADGAPPNSLTRPQLHALAGITDRDGAGVKPALTLRLLTCSDGDAAALARLRDAIAVHLKDARVAGAAAAASGGASSYATSALMLTAAASGRRHWALALQAAAAAAGRPAGGLQPREVFSALAAAAVGVVTDLATVEDAVLALMADGQAAVPVESLIDALAPLTVAGAVAVAKARRFVVTGPLASKGAPGLWRAAAAFLAGSSSAAAAGGDAVLPERVSRSALAGLLQHLGMVIVEDDAMIGRALAAAGVGMGMGSGFAGSTSARGAAPAAPVTGAATLAPGSASAAAFPFLPPGFASSVAAAGAPAQQNSAHTAPAVPAVPAAAASSASGAQSAAGPQQQQHGQRPSTGSGSGAGGGAAGAGAGAGSRFNASEFAFDLLVAADRLAMRASSSALPTAAAAGSAAPSSAAASASAAPAVTMPAPAAIAAVSPPAAAVLSPTAEQQLTATPSSAAGTPAASSAGASAPVSAPPASAAVSAAPPSAHPHEAPAAATAAPAGPVFSKLPRVPCAARGTGPLPGGCLSIAVAGAERLAAPLATLLGAHARACASGALFALMPPLSTAPDAPMPAPRVYLTFALPQAASALTARGEPVTAGSAPAACYARRVTLCASVSSRRAPAAALSFTPYLHPWEADEGAAAAPCDGGGAVFPLTDAAARAVGGDAAAQASVRSLAAFLRGALSAGAEPEASDVLFTLSLLPPPPVAPAPGLAAAVGAAPAAAVAAAEQAFSSSILAAGLFNLADLLAGGAADGSGTVEEALALDGHPENLRSLAQQLAPAIAELGGGAWLASADAVIAAAERAPSGVLGDVRVRIAGVDALRVALDA